MLMESWADGLPKGNAWPASPPPWGAFPPAFGVGSPATADPTTLFTAGAEAWAKGLDYPTMPLELSRDIYRSTRAGTRYLAALHYTQHGHLEWVHSETGVRTLRDELDKVAAHNEHHLGQIRAALGSATR